ncbi:LysR family transcriptional regulator [Listeria seeligeri]|uniref:LysR family transcriptional regulator n=1 Tax=Listeria seeligeri TaxID=1640 RepID=UPI0016241860|nr:LysR family transcriptional regulator [Listeria seeligeri]MBC1425581.1 LysR family transcriptional regulator [Listeria seeligeri]MBC1472224.1 LysR family transcriptional regulator [Listeria seeligeri]MBC1481726.1 LysR family transcriptional regulator [Listeria seeligeri]MBC1533074.1 LysR family transcriptional regulator [Listeria seeligeri]MBC1539964.1 LysR family transcriptional regulator [Listeria seeligeri]
MNINELITFKAVVEKKGFSTAAEFLDYSQSNVTKHIKKIEETVGFSLFDRGWKSTLTKEGELFYKEVDNLIDHWKSISAISEEIAAEQIGEIRIGIMEPLAKQLLPQIIHWLKTNRPKMNAFFEMGNTQRLTDLVQHNELDIAFVGENPNISPELEFKKISEDELVFIALKEHKLVREKTVEIEDVLNYPILYGDKTCLSHQRFMKVLQNNNLVSELKTHYICSNQLLIADILAEDQIGIVPRSVLNSSATNMATLPIGNKDFRLVYGSLIKKKEYNYLKETIQAIIALVTK